MELLTNQDYANEFGKDEMWVIRNFKVNLFSKSTPEGKLPIVSKVAPGSRLVLLKELEQDYEVQNPFGQGSVFINKMQVKRVLKQDTETFKSCE